MINQHIINSSTDTAKLALLNSKPTESSMLYLVDNVFDTELINSLREYVDREQLHWIENESGHKHRARISWDSDTVIEELYETCNNLTGTITDQYFGQPLNFIGTSIWKDQHLFKMDLHRDNPIINVALQVYLFDAPAHLGTSFLITNVDTPVPYLHNSGYIAVTKTQPGLQHRTTHTTPAGITRYSIYAVWSLTEKIVEKE